MSVARRWSAAEDATLAAVYRAAPDRATVLAALPGRPWGAIVARANARGFFRAPRRWTREERARLRTLWHAVPQAELAARFPTRTWVAVRRMAQALGLPSRPQGLISVKAAAARAGFGHAQMPAILRRYAHAVVVAAYPSAKPTAAPRTIRLVEPEAVEDAVAGWNATELVMHAAARHGLEHRVLRAILKRAAAAEGRRVPGHRRKWRLPSATIDAAVAAWRATETVARGARRHGVGPSTLWYWLRAAGVPRGTGRYWRIPAETIDRVVAARRTGRTS